jgi:hypothetical protein
MGIIAKQIYCISKTQGYDVFNAWRIFDKMCILLLFYVVLISPT